MRLHILSSVLSQTKQIHQLQGNCKKIHQKWKIYEYKNKMEDEKPDENTQIKIPKIIWKDELCETRFYEKDV